MSDSEGLLLIPARMLNEHVYCPRLAYLEWVQGEWADSADTEEGRRRHRRVDREGGALPDPGAAETAERIHARSVTLSSDRLGLVAKIDLVEGDGDGGVAPVDYKRGKRPHVARGVYDPERVQICAQGLLLREHGYRCERGYIYYVASKERVPVDLDAELVEQTLMAARELAESVRKEVIPAPLVGSPKCPRCSLVGICLPDETQYLRDGRTPPRPLAVVRTEAFPAYVQARRAKVSLDGERLEVEIEDSDRSHLRLDEVSQLVLQGNVYLTTPALHELMRREIPVVWTSFGGWFLGYTAGLGHKNVELRAAQYRVSLDPGLCLELARGWVRAKIANQRTLLRRNWRGGEPPDEALARMAECGRRAQAADSLEVLLGIEGLAAAAYFLNFGGVLAKRPGKEWELDFEGRNRRPPRDPVNALLSFAYALLVRTWSVTLVSVGFDPYRGFFHQPRFGRPALALDMMEPFRPLLADSTVLQVVNNGEVRASDFVSARGAVSLEERGRKALIAAYERRLDQEVTHPLFGYKLSYRRLVELQARLLGRYLLGELQENPNFTTR